jgi:hypothetical protein
MSRNVAAVALAAFAPSATAFVPQGVSLRSTAALAQTQVSDERVSTPETKMSSTTSFGLTALGISAVTAAASALARQPHRAPRTERQVVGVCMPLTDKFDPLNLSNTDAKLDRYTAVEIKHGRISMLAVMGYILPEFFRFPGTESIRGGLGALSDLPVEGWVQLAALISAHEVLVKPRQGGLGQFDFGLGTELLDGIDDEELERKQTAERNNGRLAMVAIMGLMVQDGILGQSPINLFSKGGGWWGPTVQFLVKDIGACQGPPGNNIGNVCAIRQHASRSGITAMRAEPKMSPSVPFLRYPAQLEGWAGGEKGFDPLAVTDALPVYLTREAELKHGRIAMLATLGWIATDLGARFPGDVFQKISTTVEAHNKCVEAGYMAPMFGAVGTFEVYSLWLILNGWPKEIKRDSGDYFFGKNFLPKDKDKEMEMRLKELENGRLAMFAFGGIVTQAVITGKPFPFV